ncbi:ABC transporter permease [bacterium]|nr:ABC transporter permease [bacterium]
MYAKIAVGNVRRSLSDFGVYFLTLVFGVSVFYAFNSVRQQAAILQMGADTRQVVQMLGDLIGGVSVFVAVVLGFLMVYANQFLIRRRKHEFGIYLTLGMSRAGVSGIVVCETLLVGAGALVAGVALGVALSQLMLYVTASLFKVTVSGFTLVFSGDACLAAVLCFAGMFAVTALFNVACVSRFRLIDLIDADRAVETIRVRSLPLCVALFVIALALIGTAYHVLRVGGLLTLDWHFKVATLLVSVGTLLFFFSLSGFVLRAAQRWRGLYLRGLNMFSLRELNSRVNSSWLSVSVVCAALFLGVTATAGGLAMTASVNGSLEGVTVYDASLTSWTAQAAQATAREGEPAEASGAGADVSADVEAMERDGGDMFRGIVALVPGLADAGHAQIDRYGADDLTFGALAQGVTADVGAATRQVVEAGADAPVGVMAASQFNAAMRLRDRPDLQVSESEATIVCADDTLLDYWRQVGEQRASVTLCGEELPMTVAPKVAYFQNGSSTPIGASLVVPDDVIARHADELTHSYSVLDLVYADGASAAALNDAIGSALSSNAPVDAAASSSSRWPASFWQTRAEGEANGAGMTATIAYVAIYLGFVLFVSCAAILAIQQLSAAADNVGRYRTLRELGAEPRMVSHAVLFQVAAYFVAPLALALAHAYVALGVLADALSGVGGIDPARPYAIAVAAALVLYGGYFLVTYVTARGVALGGDLRRRE